jgi:hypothetical protein
MSYAADDTQAIAARLKELQAEKDQALTGSSVPAKEEKAEDLPMGYGDYLVWSPSAFNDAVREQMTSKHQHEQAIAHSANGGLYAPLGSLAHPQWPYAGTGFEWRKFVDRGPRKDNNTVPIVLGSYSIRTS